MWKPWRRRVVMAAVLSCFVPATLAGTVNLAWNPSPTTGQNAPTGYKLWYGTIVGGAKSAIQTLGVVTATTHLNVPGGTKACYTITAFNTGGESGHSNEVCVDVPFPPADAAPANASGLKATVTP